MRFVHLSAFFNLLSHLFSYFFFSPTLSFHTHSLSHPLTIYLSLSLLSTRDCRGLSEEPVETDIPLEDDEEPYNNPHLQLSDQPAKCTVFIILCKILRWWWESGEMAAWGEKCRFRGKENKKGKGN